MRNTDYPITAIVSGCELFRRFITLAQLDTSVSLWLYNYIHNLSANSKSLLQKNYLIRTVTKAINK